jgi:hypothetical protein
MNNRKGADIPRLTFSQRNPVGENAMTNDQWKKWRQERRDFCARRDALARWLDRTGDCPNPSLEASLQMDHEYVELVRQHLS